MEFILILDMIMKILKECQENRDKEDILEGLKKPRAREALALRLALRRSGVRGRKNMRVAMEEWMTALKEMPESQLVALFEAEDDE